MYSIYNHDETASNTFIVSCQQVKTNGRRWGLIENTQCANNSTGLIKTLTQCLIAENLSDSQGTNPRNMPTK